MNYNVKKYPTNLFDELSGTFDDARSGVAHNPSHLHAVPPGTDYSACKRGTF
jgi:hypothetical protein